MLKIGICDMDVQFVEALLYMLEEILYQYADWEAQIFEDSSDVIQAIDEGRFCCNLLFMDIFQKNESGVTVAAHVEKKNVDTDIIFITTSKNHVFECYRANTFAYLLKPLQKTDISREVKRYLKEMQLNPKCLNISTFGEKIRIPLDIILYIESKYRKVIVHTKNKDYEYYEKLDNVENILQRDGFFRCHQSYLVAADKVTAYDGKVLQVGEYPVPISRRYKAAVRQMMTVEETVAAGELKERAGYVRSYVTSGLFQNNDTRGALVCVQGAYLGNIVRVVPEQSIIIGRDGTSADMIVNLPLVSRRHCSIIYHEKNNQYEIEDFSTNGTFVDGGVRLLQGEIYLLKPGTTISFGDKSVIYKLG